MQGQLEGPQQGLGSQGRCCSKDYAEAVARETQTIAEVVAREMAKAHAQYQATINEKCTPTLPTTLKVTSGSSRDGNYGHIKLDLPLMPWRETQRIPKSPIFTIGSTGKAYHR